MALTKTQVSELYVAIFNRASEGTGNSWWQQESATKSAAEIATEMMASDDAKEYFGASLDSDLEFIKHIYLNTLGKTYADDQAGIDWWVTQLAGNTRGEIVVGLVAAIQAEEYKGTDAQQQFLNRVAVSDYSADNLEGAPDNYKQALGFSGDLNVTSNPDTISLAEKAVQELAVETDGGSDNGETFLLTEALAELADAKEAQVDFLKGLELDVNNDGKYDSADHAEGKATEGNVNTVFSAAATAIAGATGTTLANTNYEDLTKQALQDVDMATAKAAAQGDVNVKTAAAKAGMTALIEAADQAKVEYNEAQEALTAANTAMTVETATFNAANTAGGFTVANTVFAAAYNPATDYSGKIIIVNGKAYTGQDGSTASGPVALTDLVEDKTVLRVAELEAANNGVVTATANVAGQLVALQEAVGAIYVAEAGGHSLKDIGSAVNTGTGVYDLTKSDVEVHKTAADAAAFGVKQVITITANVAGTAAGKITLDGVEVTLAANDSAAAIATKIAEAFQSSTKWDVTANGDEVTFAGAEAGNTPLAAAADFTDTDSTGTAVTVAANSITAATLASGAANADALKTALENLETLEKAIETFEAARDIKVELEALKKAAVDAGKAITDSVEDGGLGVSLREGDQNFTTSDDVYLFDANKTTATILSNFGAKGEDKIFLGDSFTGGLKEITKVANDNGDAGKLEIFWLQNGTNVDLYVEERSFAGNASTDSDLVKVTLTGVKGEDLSFEDGFLTIA